MGRRVYCFNCGEDLGELGRYGDQYDTCGQQECNRVAADAMAAEHEEAHEQLDRLMAERVMRERES